MMLRYSEIPHDFSAEDIKFVAVGRFGNLKRFHC